MFSLFPTTIKRMAPIHKSTPTTIGSVSGSPKATTPIAMAVMGSKEPKMAVLVAPIRRVATASISKEMVVGKTASPRRLD